MNIELKSTSTIQFRNISVKGEYVTLGNSNDFVSFYDSKKQQVVNLSLGLLFELIKSPSSFSTVSEINHKID